MAVTSTPNDLNRSTRSENKSELFPEGDNWIVETNPETIGFASKRMVPSLASNVIWIVGFSISTNCRQ